MTREKKCWTPFAVLRDNQLAWIAVLAQYNEYNDWFTVSIEGYSRTWYRRGQSMHNSRNECISRLREQGKVLG